MIYYINNYIAHHGVQGQKWGVRRYQNKDGSLTELGKRKKQAGFTIKKGTTVGRVIVDKSDKTYDNKKYVSITPQDHKKWDDYLGKGYANEGYATFQKFYETKKDLKIAGTDDQAKVIGKMLTNKLLKKQAEIEQVYADRKLPKTSNPVTNMSRQVSMQTNTAHEFERRMRDAGFDGIVDVHGTNVASLPVIVFDPDTKLKVNGTSVKYTDYVQGLIDAADKRQKAS